MNQITAIAGQSTRTSGSMTLSRRSGARDLIVQPTRTAAHYGRVRMMTRAIAAATLTAVALGGLAFSASDATGPTKCKVLSEQTERRAVARPAPGIYSGPNDQTGTQSRTVTESRCRGKLVTTYTAWH